ncbi:MAG: hypothetical protein GY859_40990 [Desulfobacterales bacterium]|nr:hypothetical protein [Desulfobacterales bacterium]
MFNETVLKEVDGKIRLMQKTADELSEMAGEMPAVTRNLVRLQASLKMLEINISDCLDPDVLG